MNTFFRQLADYPLDKGFELCFYKSMPLPKKEKSSQSKKLSLEMAGRPAAEPVVKNGFKDLFRTFGQFVLVGGDLV